MLATSTSSQCSKAKVCTSATGSARPFVRPFVQCKASVSDQAQSRRDFLAKNALAVVASTALVARPALADRLPEETDVKALCDAECMSSLESKELVTLPSGLQYRDIVVGSGPSPPVGFQVVCHYIAMTPNLRVFENSLDKGKPYDVRVGAGQVIPGLDEGLLTMKPGGVRRLYIPGNLAFPKGLRAAPGRPAVPPSSPVVFDVQLLYIPGLDDE